SNATTHAAWRQTHNLTDQGSVRAPSLAERGVEVDDRDLSGHRELLEPGQGVASVEHKVPAPAELDRATLHQVDAGDDHRRTLIPRRERSALIPSTVSSPSWNTDAASTASAPARNACATCARSPIPPEAITGTRTAPAASSRRASSTLRTPPPTVRGMRMAQRTRSTVSICVARPSGDAATSRTTISSAP